MDKLINRWNEETEKVFVVLIIFFHLRVLRILGFGSTSKMGNNHRQREKVNENDKQASLNSPLLPANTHEAFPRHTADALQIELFNHGA
jgi:hypothetical protein